MESWDGLAGRLDAPELLAEPVVAALAALTPEQAARYLGAEVVDGLGLPV